VQQEARVNFPFSAAEIVLMARAIHHGSLALESRHDLEVARSSMDLTDSLDFANRYLHELSGGEKQRVMIARALAQEPEILLLDEPSAFLDLKHQIQMFELLVRLNRERGLTIVAALHDLNLAALFFPRLVVLCNGRIHRDGTPGEVLTEKTIHEVYGIRVRIEHDRTSQKPQLFVCPSVLA
jgi:iron complex transport system ATP-binding protein